MSFRSLTTRLLLISAIALPMAAARADVDLKKFSLSRAAPADAFITVCSRTNPEREFLDKYWQRVFDAFWESEIHIDLWDMISESAPEKEIAKLEQMRGRFEILCRKVDWEAITEGEFLYTARLTDLPMPYEGLFAGRLNSKEAASKNHEGITAIFNELAKFIEAEAGKNVMKVVTEARKDKVTITKMSFDEAPFIEIALAQKDDMILLTFGKPDLMQEALVNLGDTDDTQRLVDTPRFKNAFKELPPAEDELVFFDIERMMLFMRQVATMVEREAGNGLPQPAEGQPKPFNEMSLLTAFLNDASFIDYMATTSWTDGMRAMGETIVVTKDSAKDSQLLGAVSAGGKLEAYGKYIPAEASSFSVSSGVSLPKVYDYAVDFMKKHVPDADQMLEEWDGIQQQMLKMNIKNDVLDLFGTESVSFKMGPMGRDWVSLTQVTDSKKADAQVERLLNTINDLIKQNAGDKNGLIFKKVKVGPEQELTEISHGTMIMLGIASPPVIGCADGYLIFSSSANAVRKCLLTGKGEHNNITTNSRWRKEGLDPKGNVVSVTFTDQADMADQLKQAIGGIGFMLTMAPMAAAGQMPPEVAKTMGSLNGIVMKLMPVADKMNFYQSKAAYTTWDGKTWHNYAVQNYKKPSEVLVDETKPAAAGN